jgi:SAM-dependent methyltransferase
VDDAFRTYYALGGERDRLAGGSRRGRLELTRTLELLERHLPAPPADVLDVGGGPGAYARILAERGYRVRLVDVVPLHVEQARADGRFEAVLGDARALAEDDARYDAVLLLGPLYHLTEHADRILALAEGRRVLRPGGILAAAAISRFASLLDGVSVGMLRDPAFAQVVARDLADGQHRSPDPTTPDAFTTAYFHHPAELAPEVAAAGLELVEVYGVEGPAYWFDDVEDEVALRAARAVERDASALALSAHLLAVARRP